MSFSVVWQDVVLMFGGFALSAALLPAIFHRSKPPKVTCALEAGILTVYVVAFYTLGLYLTVAAVGLNAAAWWALLVQNLQRERSLKFLGTAELGSSSADQHGRGSA